MQAVRRLTTVAGLTAGMLVTSGAAAFAHECMIASRSQQGQQAAGHSANWFSEDMASHGAYDFTFAVIGVVEPTTAMLDDAVALHLEQGLERWTSFFMQHTLLTDPKTHADNPAAEKHATDDRGVDHWFASDLGQAMIAIATQVAEEHGAL